MSDHPRGPNYCSPPFRGGAGRSTALRYPQPQVTDTSDTPQNRSSQTILSPGLTCSNRACRVGRQARMLFENFTVCPIHETPIASQNRACTLRCMGKYDEAAVEMFKHGTGVVEIARQLGCSRSTVSTALRKAGLTRKRGWRSSYVPFTPAPKHRRQHAYKMFRCP